jgi:hypothetical protein
MMAMNQDRTHPLIGIMTGLLTAHIGEVLTEGFVTDLTKFLEDEAPALIENSQEVQRTKDDLAIIEREFPIIWADEALGSLAATEIARMTHSGFARSHAMSSLDVYRVACGRVMQNITPPPGSLLH